MSEERQNGRKDYSAFLRKIAVWAFSQNLATAKGSCRNLPSNNRWIFSRIYKHFLSNLLKNFICIWSKLPANFKRIYSQDSSIIKELSKEMGRLANVHTAFFLIPTSQAENRSRKWRSSTHRCMYVATRFSRFCAVHKIFSNLWWVGTQQFSVHVNCSDNLSANLDKKILKFTKRRLSGNYHVTSRSAPICDM